MTLALIALVSAAPTPDDVHRAAGRLLAAPGYQFCHDAEYLLQRDELHLCRYASSSVERCPELGSACAYTRAKLQESEKEIEYASLLEMLLGPLTLLARVLMYALVAGVALVLVYAFARGLAYWLGHRPQARAEAVAAHLVAEGPAAAARASSAAELFARARAAAAARDFRGAVIAAYAGLLRHLHERGDIELHPSRTHGDYVRSVRGKPELYPGLRAVTREVDRVHFGGAAATTELFERVWGEVSALARGAALVLVASALVLTGCEPAGRYIVERLDRRPAGFSLLRELIAAQDVGVRRRLQRVGEIADDVGTVVVLGTLGPNEWDRLLAWATAGKQLVVAADPGPAAERMGAGITSGAGETTCEVGVVLGEGAADDAEDVPAGDDENAILVADAGASLTLDDDSFETVNGCDGPYFAWRALESGGTLVVAPGPRAFSNVALAAGNNAAVALFLLMPFGGNVELVGEWTGSGADSPYDAVRRGRLAPVLAQVLLLTLVLVFWRWPFGAPRDPPRARRRAFVEHVRALGAQYARAHAAHHVLAAYAVWALDRLRTRLQVFDRGDTEPLVAAVAARTGDETRVRAVIAAAAAAVAGSGSGSGSGSGKTPAQDLATMRELERLVARIGGNE